MSSSLPTLFVFVVVLGLMAAAWTFTPKGQNQTYASSDPTSATLVDCFVRLIRSSVLLTLTCCYLMWMVTYLAQVHPLICEFMAIVVSRRAHLGDSADTQGGSGGADRWHSAVNASGHVSLSLSPESA
jgi:V-type H+-transporting ATPase subunit e